MQYAIGHGLFGQPPRVTREAVLRIGWSLESFWRRPWRARRRLRRHRLQDHLRWWAHGWRWRRWLSHWLQTHRRRSHWEHRRHHHHHWGGHHSRPKRVPHRRRSHRWHHQHHRGGHGDHARVIHHLVDRWVAGKRRQIPPSGFLDCLDPRSQQPDMPVAQVRMRRPGGRPCRYSDLDLDRVLAHECIPRGRRHVLHFELPHESLLELVVLRSRRELLLLWLVQRATRWRRWSSHRDGDDGELHAGVRRLRRHAKIRRSCWRRTLERTMVEDHRGVSGTPAY